MPLAACKFTESDATPISAVSTPSLFIEISDIVVDISSFTVDKSEMDGEEESVSESLQRGRSWLDSETPV